MYADFYNEKNDILYIAKVSFFFHFAIIAALLLIVWLRPEKEAPPPIPFFEMVNVMPPPPQPVAKQSKPKPPDPAPPEPAPEIKPELAPEIKPVKTPKPETPKPKQESKPEPKPAAPEPSMDMPMDMPTDIKKPDMDMPALRTLGSIIMDPQIEAYLKTVHKLVYQNFNPPSGTAIAKGTKSSIQFQIARDGEITEVILRASSGNSIWDRLATRAVQITKPPPLPPSYDAEILPLIFDFREK